MGPSVTSTIAHPYFWYSIALLATNYATYVAVYRRFFHPLAKVLGASLAAVTFLYQSSFNWRYYLQIEKLHERYPYSPVVRIPPDQAHLCDLENYDRIYFIGARFWKSPRLYNAVNAPHSTFDTLPNDLRTYLFRMVRGCRASHVGVPAIPVLPSLALKTPPWLAPYLSEPLGHVTSMQMEGVKQTEDVKARMAAGRLDPTERPTIFLQLLDPEKEDGWPVPHCRAYGARKMKCYETEKGDDLDCGVYCGWLKSEVSYLYVGKT
ncbi:hypothetical protein NA57DRAFT_70745 [Rhizodiscina lignyota]|uniref:Uncharacterized protein n=1 Tax=Rhizodiscina lignyota TaxID=1504668 RepID=A0A9P4IN22_9PEZI|nr:hypothetical protein NA57DRAFT_70745 [Rhizodiscina lignyota]